MNGNTLLLFSATDSVSRDGFRTMDRLSRTRPRVRGPSLQPIPFPRSASPRVQTLSAWSVGHMTIPIEMLATATSTKTTFLPDGGQTESAGDRSGFPSETPWGTNRCLLNKQSCSTKLSSQRAFRRMAISESERHLQTASQHLTSRITTVLRPALQVTGNAVYRDLPRRFTFQGRSSGLKRC